ncbi:SseB family protein [Arthrobacter sp.]|uniref:SseB family protein n=1 Tax=Arthrobacter sp. TaxID=1667 RepID=UPI003A8CB6CD
MSEEPNETPSETPDPDEPQTHLETVLHEGQADEAMAGQVIATFLSEEVFFLSREQVTEETDNVQPLLLQNKDGEPVIALFTHVNRIPETYIAEAPFAVRVVGAAVIDNLSGAGLVLNPGHQLGFESPAGGLGAIKREFAPGGAPPAGAPPPPGGRGAPPRASRPHLRPAPVGPRRVSGGGLLLGPAQATPPQGPGSTLEA